MSIWQFLWHLGWWVRIPMILAAWAAVSVAAGLFLGAALGDPVEESGQ